MLESLSSLSNTVGNNMVRQIRAAVPADSRFVRSSSGISVDSVNYYGSLVFENGQLSKGLFDGGYVEQVNHYYAFGGLMGESTGGDTQRFKYNGKELDRMSGLDWYDYGARHYDAMRFTTMDPLTEKYYSISPYAYCANNPVSAIDPDGRVINWLVGGLIGAGVELGSQLIESYDPNVSIIDNLSQNVNWTNVAIAAGEGTLTSGVSALKGVGAKVAVAAVSSAAKDVSAQVKDGANSVKDINYQKVGVEAVAGAVIAKGAGMFSKVKTNKEFKNVKAIPPKATKHKRAGQKRYSKSAQHRANRELTKQKEEYANKVEEYANALQNAIYSFIKRENK